MQGAPDRCHRRAVARAGRARRLLPATDDPVRTVVETAGGELDFQAYFVGAASSTRLRHPLRRECDGRASAAALAAIREAELLVIGPSNPLVSIGPILALPGMREAVERGCARGSR